MVTIREEESGIGGSDDYETPLNGTSPEEDVTWETIWNAPDYSQLIATRQSRRAKEYTSKANSVAKALTMASIQAGDFPDAAALLHYGPPFTHALGQLADQNKRVAQAVDMLTTPSSPVVMFAVAAIALGSQIARNHEAQIKEIPNARKRAKAIKKTMKQNDKVTPPRFTVKVLGRQIPIRFRSRIKFGAMFAGFRSQTQEPQQLTFSVFSDPKVIAALEKQGFKLVSNDGPAA